MRQPMNLRYGRWLNHGITAPLCALLGTYLWANAFGDGEWLFWRNFDALALADFYGAFAFPIVILMYELLAWIWRSGYTAGRSDGIDESQFEATRVGRREGQEAALTAAWRLAETSDAKALVRAAAGDLDITLPALLGGPSATIRLEVLSPWDSIWRRFADASAELRQRLDAGEVEDELDYAMRSAISAAVTDLTKRIEGLDELAERKRRSSSTS